MYKQTVIQTFLSALSSAFIIYWFFERQGAQTPFVAASIFLSIFIASIASQIISALMRIHLRKPSARVSWQTIEEDFSDIELAYTEREARIKESVARERLVINYDKKKIGTFIRSLALLLACLSIFYLCTVNIVDRYFLSHWIVALRIILVSLVLFIFGSLVWSICEFVQTKPYAVLDDHGSWLRPYGFIPWKEIKRVGYFSLGNVPHPAIGIHVWNPEKIAQTARWDGKIELFWSRLYSRPHICVSPLFVEDDFVQYAHHKLDLLFQQALSERL